MSQGRVQIPEEAIERVAMALCDAHYALKEIALVSFEGKSVAESAWQEQGTTGKQEWREMARAAVDAAVEALGLTEGRQYRLPGGGTGPVEELARIPEGTIFDARLTSPWLPVASGSTDAEC